ncbi:Imm6 family immunity protein [Peribacillus sp. B-H-3]|jgi:hypothetical protein|uniref:Imm6 family immunity protein n=1 Tax=Peribacillus sp. B-H-3 TaxID=3400420 RepID=UPI003B01B8A3
MPGLGFAAFVLLSACFLISPCCGGLSHTIGRSVTVNCLGNALAYTIWEAYQYEKEKYLPQTIESVDYDTVESFITNFEKVYENNSLSDNLLHFLEENYPKDADKKVDLTSIKTFIINESIEK